MNFVGVLATIIWAVVGLLVWIPLLVRTTAVYCAAVTFYAIGGTKARGLASMLPDAISFYGRGFQRIEESFDEDDTNDPREPVPIGRVAIECGWTLVFWLTLGLTIRAAFGGPSTRYTFIIGSKSGTVPYYVSGEKGDWGDASVADSSGGLRFSTSYRDVFVRFDASTSDGFQESILRLADVREATHPVSDADWDLAPRYEFFVDDKGKVQFYLRR